VHETSFVLKICTVVLLLFFTSFVLTSARRTAKTIATGLFTFSLAGYTACQISHPVVSQYWFSVLLLVSVFPVSVAFFILSESLFQDKFRFRWLHLALFVLAKSVNVLLFLEVVKTASGWERLLPQAITLVLVSFALWKVFIVKRDDLVETRRKFRIHFVTVTGSLIFFVLAQEILFTERNIPAVAELINSALILAGVWFFGIKLFRSGGNSFSAPQPGEKTDAQNMVSEEIERRLTAGLADAMEREKIYARDGLSIRKLAEFLQVQEYVLRRHINSVMGYRNFNDFVNDFRIREARRILASKTEDRQSIIRIALDLGFGSLAPFNRAFKERTGMPPSEFRKSAG
jgi:AraC-like DNA-binding protein